MNFKIKKAKTSKVERYEVRAWDGTGDARTEWRRRFDTKSEAQAFVDGQIYNERDRKKHLKLVGGDPLTLITMAQEVGAWQAAKYPDLAPDGHATSINIGETCLPKSEI